MVCAWIFTNVVLEQASADSWYALNELESESSWEVYLRCFYLVINVVTSVGYGDMMPSTDTERVFFVLLINAGDVLFALAFGLIAQITMRSRMEGNEAV